MLLEGNGIGETAAAPTYLVSAAQASSAAATYEVPPKNTQDHALRCWLCISLALHRELHAETVNIVQR